MPGQDVIMPPDDILKLIEKTAEFVAANGSAVEMKVWEAQKTNPKFSFLRPGDPFRKFYEQKIYEYAEKLEQDEEFEEIEEQFEEAPTTEIKAPEVNPFYVKHPTIAKVDMDIIKLAAQFVARNGRNFWMGLTERESKNPQFDFLKPNHALFNYFTSLIEAYSRCILPRLDDIKSLQKNVADRGSILQRCMDRFQFERNQIKSQKSKEEMEEEERQQMAMIDWHDFVVVETIELREEEELPAPIDLNIVHTLGSRPFMQDIEQNVRKQITESLEESAKRAKEALGAGRERAKKSEIDTGAATDISNYTQKCEKCGEMIPIDLYDEHIKLELLDPKYKKEREAARIKEKDHVFAANSEIYQNLKNMMKNRAEAMGDFEENKEEPGEISAAKQRNELTAMSSANISQLIQELKKSQPAMPAAKEVPKFVPPPPPPPSGQMINPLEGYVPPPSMVQPLAGPSYQAAAVMERTPYRLHEETRSSLVPEQQWAKMHPGTSSIHIRVPDDGGDNQWGFKGQIIQLSVDLLQSIQSIKQMLSGILGGMPPQKMKFKTHVHSVLKDQDTLAKYNISNGAMIELALKERGGRKRG
ncbi:unnamed protein product [Blepharisma stoltei]|uniref:Splicing factor 3A subunit 1 n=1 Tax=Blepharisma stoltei TaxID=1481888 RepID=A0AAU9JDW2_9CILI|nr:unnamed protein product [Blepharisma stoltei]